MTTAVQSWFAHPYGFILLAVLPCLGALGFWEWRCRDRQRQLLGSPAALTPLIVKTGRAVSFLRASALMLGLTALVMGITGPRWAQDANAAVAPARDLVVVIDLSQSMLAQDVLPS